MAVLKYFGSWGTELKIYKDFELNQVFMYNFYCLIDLNILTKNQAIFFSENFLILQAKICPRV